MENKEFQYQMLDRLRTDCEYFLGNGRANKDTLYYKDIDEHIAEMQGLYTMIEEKPDWISYNQIERYGKEMHERENIIDEYKETLKSIPENLEKYKNSLQINDYSVNNYQLRSNVETIKDIVEHLEEIDKSKENINVLVLWSESDVYKDNKLYTLSEMEQKSLSATENIYLERKKLELDGIYDKTKIILIGKEDNNLLLYKDRYDIGDYPSFIDDLKHSLSEEKYNKFTELDNSGLIGSKALQEENTQEFTEFKTISEEVNTPLLEGWKWQMFDDGSGSLLSPTGESYFSYDWNTYEYKIDKDSSWNYFGNRDDFGNPLTFEDFQKYAEQCIIEHPEKFIKDEQILEKLKENIKQDQDFQEDNEVKYKEANHPLLKDWKWEIHKEGFGHLISPDNMEYMYYDLEENICSVDDVDSYEDPWGNCYDTDKRIHIPLNVEPFKYMENEMVKALEQERKLNPVKFEREQEENTRVEKIKEFLNLSNDMDYKDYFAAILLNEVVESKQDIQDIQKQDLEVCDKFFNEYMKNDSMKLLSNEIIEMINGKYEKKKEQELEEDEDLE